MKKVKLINLKGEEVKELKVNEIFDITPNDKVLYDAIILEVTDECRGFHFFSVVWLVSQIYGSMT